MSERASRGIAAKLQLITLLYFIFTHYGKKKFTVRDIEREIGLGYTSIENLMLKAMEDGYLYVTNGKQKSFFLSKGGVVQSLKLSQKGIEVVKKVIEDLNTQRLVIAHSCLNIIRCLIPLLVFFATNLNYIIAISVFLALIALSSVFLNWYGKKERIRLLRRLLTL